MSFSIAGGAISAEESTDAPHNTAVLGTGAVPQKISHKRPNAAIALKKLAGEAILVVLEEFAVLRIG